MKARVLVMTLAAFVTLHTALAHAEDRPTRTTSSARAPRNRGKGTSKPHKTTPKPAPAPAPAPAAPAAPATTTATSVPPGATTVNAGAEVITTTTLGVAAAPDPSTVLVVGKGRVARLVQRVTADLGRLGLKVEQGEDRGTSAAVLTLDRTRDGVVVRVESPGGKQPATEETMRGTANAPPDDEIVAAHSVELVRAALEASAKAKAEEPAAAEVAVAPVPEPEPPPPPPPPPAPPPPPPSVIGFEVQGGISYPLGDFGIAPALHGFAYTSLSPFVDTGIYGSIPLGSSSSSSGSTRLSASSALAGMALRFHPWGRNRRFDPTVAVVGGGAFVQASAKVSAPLVPQAADGLVPFVAVRAGVGYRITPILELRIDVLAGFLTQAPVLRIDGEEVARYGSVLLSPSAGIGIEL